MADRINSSHLGSGFCSVGILQGRLSNSGFMMTQRLEDTGVVLTATNTLMAELAQDWSRPEGGQLLGILFNEVLPKIG